MVATFDFTSFNKVFSGHTLLQLGLDFNHCLLLLLLIDESHEIMMDDEGINDNSESESALDTLLEAMEANDGT